MARFLFTMSALVLLAGFCGRFHGIGDSLALLRPLMVPVMLFFSLWVLLIGPGVLGLLGGGLAVASAVTMLPPAPVSFVDDTVPEYRVYQKNLLFRLPDIRPVAEDILASGADFVTLQELHVRNRPILEALRLRFPHQHFCPFAAVGGIAVLSRWPPVPGQMVCEDFGGLAAMQVESPDGPLWVVSIHLHWPYPYRQTEQLAELLPMLQSLGGAVVVGGDFNMVTWSHAVDMIQLATRTTYAGYPGGTFLLSLHKDGQNLLDGLPRLPIDHVLVPDTAAALAVERRARLGSDHHGVIATFAWPHETR